MLIVPESPKCKALILSGCRLHLAPEICIELLNQISGGGGYWLLARRESFIRIVQQQSGSSQNPVTGRCGYQPSGSPSADSRTWLLAIKFNTLLNGVQNRVRPNSCNLASSDPGGCSANLGKARRRLECRECRADPDALSPILHFRALPRRPH